MFVVSYVEGSYFKAILDDYKNVAIETAQDMKAKPAKTAFYLSALAGVGYLMKTNPSERSFHGQILEYSNELLQLGDAVRNPSSNDQVQDLIESYNAGCIRHLNLGICSLMWRDNYDATVDLYEARCKSTKVRWLDMKDRIVDIGVVGRWLWLEKALIDYDINPNEWQEEPIKQ